MGVKMFLLFSHKLTQEQILESKTRFGITDFIYLSDKLQSKWSNVPSAGKLNKDYFSDITEFILLQNKNGIKVADSISEERSKCIEDDDIQSVECTYALVQGEFGAVCYMVNWCFKNSIVPIYSTTERVYSNEDGMDGSIINKHVFKHVEFREYFV